MSLLRPPPPLLRSECADQTFPSSHATNTFSRFKASWQEVAGVVVFSAIPFTAVKAIANSPLGEELQRRMKEKKQLYKDNSSKLKALSDRARTESTWCGEDRPRWLGPISYDYPAYLTGELPGDYHFDIAGLSHDPVALQRYFNFEVVHARWAMLAALGALIPEILHLVGAFHFVEPVWWRVGYSKPLGIYLPWDINYPGGVFDPLNLSQDPVAFKELKIKEIKNGRLAMVAWLGFYAQVALTRKGPVENLLDHISDHFHNNLLSALKFM